MKNTLNPKYNTNNTFCVEKMKYDNIIVLNKQEEEDKETRRKIRKLMLNMYT